MTPRRLLAVALIPLLAALAVLGLLGGTGAADPGDAMQKVAAPTTVGEEKVVPFQGMVLPGTNTDSDCDPGSSVDRHSFELAVPEGTYDRLKITYEFKIEYTPVTRPEVNDLILTVINPAIPRGTDNDEDEGDDREVGSSDGGAPVEVVTATNLDAATYEALVCPFIEAPGPQSYKGTLTMKAEAAEEEEKSLPAAPANGLDFTATVPADPQRREVEPIIEIDNNGNAYTCGPSGVTSTEYAQVSTDGGDQFNPLGEGPQYRPTAVPGGGDCSTATSPFANPDGQFPVAFTGLGPLTNFVTARSADNGRTIESGNSNSIPGVDRQWTAFVNPEKVLLSYNQLAPFRQIVVQRSLDRGRTYQTDSRPASPVNALFPGPMRTMDGKFNPVNPGKRVAYFGFDDFNENVYLSVSFDEGESWNNCFVAKQGGESTLFVTTDNDSAGNIFVNYGEDTGFHNFVSALPVDKLKDCDFRVSTIRAQQTGFPKPEDGPKFTTPVQVDREGIRTSVFPWIAAGGEPGKVAVAFYGTETDGNPDLAAFKASWHVYVNQSLNLLKQDGSGNFVENPDATFSQVRATTHPFHYDSICLGGLGCSTSGGDRSLADFFAIDYNPKTGKLQSAYNQSYKRPDETGGRVGLTAVFTQRSGPSLGGGDVTPDPRPVLRDTSEDPAEDAQTDPSTLAPTPRASRNEPALDFRSVTTGPEVDPETGAPVPDGGITVTMKLGDLSTPALNRALAGSSPDRSSRSLVYLFRFFNGYLTSAASARYTSSGFTFGFNDYQRNSTGECLNSSCQVYRGEQAIKGKVDQAAGTIVLSIPRAKLKALEGPQGPDQRPAEVPAKEGSRFYDGTAFSLGNVVSATQSTQSFLLRFDNTPAMDFVLPGPKPGEAGPGEQNRPGPAAANPAPRPNPASAPAPTCRQDTALRNVGVRSSGRGALLQFERRVSAPVTADVFQQSIGRRVTGERLVARFTGRTGSFRWNGRANRRGKRVRNGYLFVRYTIRTPQGKETRRVALRRTNGRLSMRRPFTARETCRLLTRTKLNRPVFGGSTGKPLTVAFRARRNTTVSVEVFRGTRLVRRLRSGAASSARTVRSTLAAGRLPRGDYTVRVTAGSGSDRQVETMTSRRL